MNHLITADLHVSNSLPFAKRPASSLPGLPATDRLIDAVGILVHIAGIAYENSCEHVWILGDFWDKALLDAMTLKMVLPILKKMGKDLKIHIIPGNHERFNAECEAYNDDFLRNIRGVTVHNAFETLKFGDVTVDVCPYLPLERHIELLSKAKGGDYLFTHQSITGARNKGYLSPTGLNEAVLSGWKYVYLGHFHDHQTLFSDDSMYVGSPWQLDFGESQDKHVWISRLEGDKPEPIKTKFPIFETVTVDLSDSKDINVNDLFNHQDYQRVIVEGKQFRLAEEQRKIFEDDSNCRVRKVDYRVMDDDGKCDIKAAEIRGGKLNLEDYINRFVEDKADAEEEEKAVLKDLGVELCVLN